MKPVIAITTSYIKGRQIVLNDAYTKAITEAGGLPLLVSIEVERDIEQVLQIADGVLLTGGYDMHPFYYQEEPCLRLGEIVPKRDDFEIKLVKEALFKKMPLFGICRGHQVLNVALGGTLYQDLETQYPSKVLQHKQLAMRDVASHIVQVEEGNLLRDIVGQSQIAVNSFHHQAVKKVAASLKVVALASDGVIEALVDEHLPFCLSVQWHPEEQAIAGDLSARKLFQAFIHACR